jgi:hypothetical protein
LLIFFKKQGETVPLKTPSPSNNNIKYFEIIGKNVIVPQFRHPCKRRGTRIEGGNHSQA